MEQQQKCSQLCSAASPDIIFNEQWYHGSHGRTRQHKIHYSYFCCFPTSVFFLQTISLHADLGDTELICLAVLPFSPVNEHTALSIIEDEVQRCCTSAASSSSREKKGEANKLCAMPLPSQVLNLGTLNPVKQQQ